MGKSAKKHSSKGGGSGGKQDSAHVTTAATTQEIANPATKLEFDKSPETTTKPGGTFRPLISESSTEIGKPPAATQMSSSTGLPSLPIVDTLSDLIYWRNPAFSAIAFTLGLVILLSLSFFSIISVVAYTLLLTLLVTLTIRVLKLKAGDGHPFMHFIKVEETSPASASPDEFAQQVHAIVDLMLSPTVGFLTRMRDVLSIKSYFISFLYLLIFWTLTYIGAWFNGLTLLILAYMGAFSLPKGYDKYKSQVDRCLGMVNYHITEFNRKVPLMKSFPIKKKD